MKKEEPLIWSRDHDDYFVQPKEPLDPSHAEESIRVFRRASKYQRGALIIGLAVMWLLGNLGCYLAGLVLHETAHVF